MEIKLKSICIFYTYFLSFHHKQSNTVTKTQGLTRNEIWRMGNKRIGFRTTENSGGSSI